MKNSGGPALIEEYQIKIDLAITCGVEQARGALQFITMLGFITELRLPDI